MEYLLCEHGKHLKMDILPSRKDFRIDDVTGKNRNIPDNSYKNKARKTKIDTLKLFAVLNPKNRGHV